MKTQLLQLSEIVTTSGTQIRARIDTDTVDDYATAMLDGAVFPPIVAFHDGNQYILADGFHRVMAANRNGFKDIEADVRKGTKPDALKYALGANATHGIKRTNSDKHRSVELALNEWPKMSDREIAKICAVSNNFVSEVRKSQLSLDDSSTRIGADGKERKLPKKKSSTSCQSEKTPVITPTEQVDETQPESKTQVVEIPLDIQAELDVALENIGSVYVRSEMGDLSNSDLDEVAGQLLSLAKQLKTWRIQ